MSMLWRSWLAIVTVLATVLTLMGALAVLQFDAVLTRLIQGRLAVIAETTASPFRSVIDLGLPIATVRNAADILARAKDIDPAVSEIRVFHQTGIVVHATDAEHRAPIAKDILLVQSVSSGDRWTVVGEDELLAGLTLRGFTGNPIGGILVSTGSDYFEGKSDSMTIRIALAAAAIFVLSAALTLLMLRLQLGGVIRGLRRLERLSEAFSDDRPAMDQGAVSSAGPQYGFLSAEIVRLESQLSEAFRNFRAALREVRELSDDRAQFDTGQAPDPGESRPVLASVPATSLARAFTRNLTPWAAAIILGSALLLGVFVHGEVTRSFEPELAARTKLIGAVANRNVQRSVDAGVPLTSLVGAERYFGDLLRHFPEVSYFGIATGRIVYEAGTRQKSLFGPERSRKDIPTFPITADGGQIGYVIIDADPEYFALQFRDILLDFGTILLVVMLLAFQIMILVMSRSLTAPFMQLQHLASLQAANDFSRIIVTKGATAIDRLGRRLSAHALKLHAALAAVAAQAGGGRDGAALRDVETRFGLRRGQPDRLLFSYLNDVRLPLFLFTAADELPLAFFPIFTKGADNPLTWLDPGVVISLPLAGYLFAITFGSPLARPLAERFGHRRLLLLAVLPTLIGHLGLYFSTNVIEIIAFRTLAGLGFGITTLACQDYVLDVVTPQERNRSLAQFTAAMFGGIFAGTALGGVLADRLGQDTVFAVSAALVLISGAMTYRLLPSRPLDGTARSEPRGSYLPPIWKPLRSLRFSALVFGIALPGNIVLQAFISFLVALELNALGASSADIGRILMTYFIAIVFVGPAVPYLFEKRLAPWQVSIIGGVIVGISLSAVVASPSPWTMLIAVAGAGVGSGMIRDTQVATAMEIAERELAHLGAGAVLGSLRTLERLGSIFGLVAIALLSSYVGYVNAIGIIAGLVLAGAAGFAIVSFKTGLNSQSRRTEESPGADSD